MQLLIVNVIIFKNFWFFKLSISKITLFYRIKNCVLTVSRAELNGHTNKSFHIQEQICNNTIS